MTKFNFIASQPKVLFSTSSSPVSLNSKNNMQGKLHPDFITGFTDGEGFFGISISKNDKLKTGWQIQLRFIIGVHIKDTLLLEQRLFWCRNYIQR